MKLSAPNLNSVLAAAQWKMFTRPTVESSRTLLILGEAPGAEEEISGIPFVGQSGKLLTDIMQQAGLDRREWHILNTFIERPPNNDLMDESWTLTKTAWRKTYGTVPPSSPPPLKKRHLRIEHLWQIEELHERLRLLKPDLIVAMGATPLWALSGESAVTLFRGNFFDSPFGPAIATLHPASILYQYANMPIVWADLVKVRMWLDGTLPKPVRRRLWLNPSFAEISAVYNRWRANRPNDIMGVDIETCPSIDQITTISFSFEDEGICIPLWDRYQPDKAKQNYWPTPAEEVAAWRWIDRFAKLPNPKVTQNGLYDAQYLLDAPLPIRLANWSDDTAIMQHSYQPELPKALGVLGSLYLNEPGWKQMRASAKDAKVDE